ncbi:excalibur calcium-binding domain-containing protein [Micromonospora sonneratiae]|uniref:Excalibur calcium-binding domain-containing protein n=1 Tax=Micromonospora sonneratiae TaxID=1184706 RepID=A0ABW3YBP2_9ACTN
MVAALPVALTVIACGAGSVDPAAQSTTQSADGSPLPTATTTVSPTPTLSAAGSGVFATVLPTLSNVPVKPTPTPAGRPTTKSPAPTPKRTAATKSGGGSVYYANCAAVRAAGKAPLYRGQPGYSRKLDRDGDGVACE